MISKETLIFLSVSNPVLQYSDLKEIANDKPGYVICRSRRIMKTFWSCHLLMNRNGTIASDFICANCVGGEVLVVCF